MLSLSLWPSDPVCQTFDRLYVNVMKNGAGSEWRDPEINMNTLRPGRPEYFKGWGGWANPWDIEGCLNFSTIYRRKK